MADASETQRTMDDPLAAATAAVRLLVEVIALVALGYWGYRTAGPAPGIGLALGVAAVWSAFGAPAAPRRLPDPWRFGLELLVTGGAAVALAVVADPVLGAAFGVLAVVNAVAVRALGES